MNKKVVVLGGGTGMSTLLKGLKQFPIDITAIVSVCDDGKSTGRLREEFNTPAVGDIRKVIVSLAEKDSVFGDVINYRFQTTSDLNGHTVGNLILTALSEITGNLSDAIESISKILKLKGRVLPLTEDCVTLMGKMEDGEIIEGEHNITECPKKIKEVYYKEEPVVCEASLKAIREADLIILSMGSLYTSILPNLLCHDILKELEKSNSKIMYVSNMMTQPGETDNYKVSDHLKILNKYLKNRKVDVVIANNSIIDKNILKKYETLEQKDQVILDEENIDIEIIQNDYVNIQDEVIRHKVDKLALDIYAYLIR
jgi:uncharacterized cofD-like protein